MGTGYRLDQLQVTARISTSTPERSQDLGDNNASASIDVLRPNVYVDATGPSRIVAQGSVFWYVLDYGNLYRSRPALTRAAEQVILRATLPDEVRYAGADRAPGRGAASCWNGIWAPWLHVAPGASRSSCRRTCPPGLRSISALGSARAP
ncbi:hypothetical protein HC891_20675 [Candidatus Gracilibacteria bacterium]|nr:hypothetical protein [Candidatus Gracilibacteria bacterium]